MRDYIITLLGVSIICGIIQILAPEGNGDGIKKHVKLISVLCVLCVAISPLGGVIEIFSSLDINISGELFGKQDLTEYNDIYLNTLEIYNAESVSDTCEGLVCERFGIERKSFDISVSLTVCEESFSVNKAVLLIHSKGLMEDPEKIAEYLSSMLECKCEIIYD